MLSFVVVLVVIVSLRLSHPLIVTHQVIHHPDDERPHDVHEDCDRVACVPRDKIKKDNRKRREEWRVGSLIDSLRLQFTPELTLSSFNIIIRRPARIFEHIFAFFRCQKKEKEREKEVYVSRHRERKKIREDRIIEKKYGRF